MTQGVLGFQYEEETQSTGLTGKAGLGLYLDLMAAIGLPARIDEALSLRPTQGWTDLQHISALILLNVAGGDFLDDLDKLEADEGLCELMSQIESQGLHPTHRQELAKRWRVEKKRMFPSPDATASYLEAFDTGTERQRKQAEGAFIPEASEPLEALRGLVGYTAGWRPPQEEVPAVATLDLDATLVESHKRTAKPSYKGFAGFQPLNLFWADRATMLASEFRDGNCPAAWRNLETLVDGLERLPEGVEEVRLRADTAGYQKELLKYCADVQAGEFSERFGVIEFAVGVDVTPAFKQAVSQVEDWQPLEVVDPSGVRYATGQEWAQVNFVPNWLGYTKRDLGIRFFAIREPLNQPSLFDEEDSDQQELDFPTMEFGDAGPSKVFGMVTNRREISGGEAICWHRKRCGASEQVHSELKHGLAGGHPPSSDDFQANAAWWQIALLAYNLHVLMQTDVIRHTVESRREASCAEGASLEDDATSQEGVERSVDNRRRSVQSRRRKRTDASSNAAERSETPTVRRMKTERFRWLNIPARVIRHARRLIIRLPRGHEALDRFIQARQRIAEMTRAPPTRWMPG